MYHEHGLCTKYGWLFLRPGFGGFTGLLSTLPSEPSSSGSSEIS